MRRGRLARSVWQDLVDDHGFRAGYASVRRFVAKLRVEAPREAHPRIETPPGQEAQVDYGDGPMVRDPGSGKYRRTRLFVLTLGCSRKAARLLTWKSSTRTWAELHERAFRRLGAEPALPRRARSLRTSSCFQAHACSWAGRPRSRAEAGMAT